MPDQGVKWASALLTHAAADLPDEHRSACLDRAGAHLRDEIRLALGPAEAILAADDESAEAAVPYVPWSATLRRLAYRDPRPAVAALAARRLGGDAVAAYLDDFWRYDDASAAAALRVLVDSLQPFDARPLAAAKALRCLAATVGRVSGEVDASLSNALLAHASQLVSDVAIGDDLSTRQLAEVLDAVETAAGTWSISLLTTVAYASLGDPLVWTVAARTRVADGLTPGVWRCGPLAAADQPDAFHHVDDHTATGAAVALLGASGRYDDPLPITSTVLAPLRAARWLDHEQRRAVDRTIARDSPAVFADADAAADAIAIAGPRADDDSRTGARIAVNDRRMVDAADRMRAHGHLEAWAAAHPWPQFGRVIDAAEADGEVRDGAIMSLQEFLNAQPVRPPRGRELTRARALTFRAVEVLEDYAREDPIDADGAVETLWKDLAAAPAWALPRDAAIATIPVATMPRLRATQVVDAHDGVPADVVADAIEGMVSASTGNTSGFGFVARRLAAGAASPADNDVVAELRRRGALDDVAAALASWDDTRDLRLTRQLDAPMFPVDERARQLADCAAASIPASAQPNPVSASVLASWLGRTLTAGQLRDALALADSWHDTWGRLVDTVAAADSST